MKKRVRTTGRVRRLRLAMAGGMPGIRARSHAERRTIDRPGDDPNVTVVQEQQFDALLALLDAPPAVSDDLRREIAQRRWK